VGVPMREGDALEFSATGGKIVQPESAIKTKTIQKKYFIGNRFSIDEVQP
jgi:hypothetical protein